MSEMLANYYFLIQNYSKAFVEFQKASSKKRYDSTLKKKLILCLIKLGRFEEAFQTFTLIINKNDLLNYSLTSVSEQILCRQIINEVEREIQTIENIEKNLIRGILWTFCDLSKAKKYFQNVNKKRELIQLKNKIINVIKQSKTRRSTKNGKQTN